MTIEEHKKILNDLQTATTDADKMKFILELDKDYSSILTDRDNAVNAAKLSEDENKKWAKLNRDLWLENSNQKKAAQTTPIDEQPTEEPPQKRSYEDLEKEF